MIDLSALLGELEAARDLPLSVLNDVHAWDATRRAELVAGAVQLFSHPSPDVRSKSLWLLTSIEAGPEHTAALAACLRDPDASVRFGAARALVRQKSNALPALGALVAAFDDPSLPVRDSAGWAVSNIGAASVPTLVELLAAPTVAARATAAAVLGNIAAIPPRFKEALSAEAAAALLPP
jgi:HEAT repeat protein